MVSLRSFFLKKTKTKETDFEQIITANNRKNERIANLISNVKDVAGNWSQEDIDDDEVRVAAVGVYYFEERDETAKYDW